MREDIWYFKLRGLIIGQYIICYVRILSWFMLLISASATHFNSCFLSPFLVSYPIAWISFSLTKRNLHIKKTNNSVFLKLYTDIHTPINIWSWR